MLNFSQNNKGGKKALIYFISDNVSQILVPLVTISQDKCKHLTEKKEQSFLLSHLK